MNTLNGQIRLSAMLVPLARGKPVEKALDAAAEPDDLSEWADMQFLLWDAQRRAGISDGEITAAMEEKLKVNMARQWPEPKRRGTSVHIKEQSEQEKNKNV